MTERVQRLTMSVSEMSDELTAFKVKPYGSVWCRTVSYGTEEETEPETEPETDADADGEAKREKQVFL